ncbi:MAG: hypothetical protein ABI821_13195 [Pseudomonadota bacterium]
MPPNAGFSATIDGAWGHSIVADFTLVPTAGLSFNLRGGQSPGAALSYGRFADASNYLSGTPGGRRSIAAGNFEVLPLGRRRDMSADTDTRSAEPYVERHVEPQLGFLRRGWRPAAHFQPGNLSVYTMGVRYGYDDDFDDFLALAQSPQ